MPPVAPRMEPRVEVTVYPAWIRGGSRSAAHAQVGAAAAKLKIASAGVMEREDICVRFIRTSASVPDGRPRPRVATCAAAGAHPDCERTG